ncbi:MAG: polymer-forming cytoskeletal protein [Acidobacteriota bacterium]
MFKKNVPTTNITDIEETVSENRVSLLGKDMKLKGNITSNEEIIIEGTVDGKVNITNNIYIGKSGKVKAEIFAREIIIEGEVNGDVHGSVKVEIVPGGILNGNIISEKVVLAEGAKFKGNIDMTIKTEDKTKKLKTEKTDITREKPKKI